MALKYLQKDSRGKTWVLRLYKGAGGQKTLGKVAEYPREADIEPLYYKEMAKHKQAQRKPEPVRVSSTLRDFVLKDFLPYAERTKKGSTLKGYKQIWKTYLDKEVGSIKLSDFTRADALFLLERLQQDGYSHNLVQNVKVVLGSIFKRVLKVFSREIVINPIHDLELEVNRELDANGEPVVRKVGSELDGARYSKKEFELLLCALSGKERALVATAFYAALRPGEVAALKWEDDRGSMLQIERAVWNGIVDTPKTKSSRASVPILGPLRSILDAYRSSTAGVEWMFPGETGNPVRLHALAERKLKAACEKVGLDWRGFYAFRRGATDWMLLDLEMEFDEVRAYLRHQPKSRVLEQHYPAEATKRSVQQRTVATVAAKIEKRVAEQDAVLIEKYQQASGSKPTMLN